MEFVYVNGKLFKQIFTFIKEINSEANIFFSEEGLDICLQNETHCSLLKIVMYSECFKEYNHSSNIEVGLNINNFCKILSCIKENEEIKIIISEDVDKLDISFGKYDFSLNTMTIDEERLEIPETDYDVNYECKCSSFKELCSNAMQFSDEINIKFTDENILFMSSGDIGDFKLKWDDEDIIHKDNKDEFDMNFSLNFINQFTKIICTSENFNIRCSKNIPIVLNIDLDDISIDYFIAPKFIDDD